MGAHAWGPVKALPGVTSSAISRVTGIDGSGFLTFNLFEFCTRINVAIYIVEDLPLLEDAQAEQDTIPSYYGGNHDDGYNIMTIGTYIQFWLKKTVDGIF